MANMKYFSDMNGTTVELMKVSTMHKKEFAELFPGVGGRRYDCFYMQIGFATKSRSPLPVTRAIEYKAFPSKHKCDARCMDAKGFLCECSCGGKNHGNGGMRREIVRQFNKNNSK